MSEPSGPPAGAVGRGLKAAVAAASAGALLIVLGLQPADGGRPPDTWSGAPSAPRSRLARVMGEMDAICRDIAAALRPDGGPASRLDGPLLEAHGRTLASLARSAREMTEGTQKAARPVEEWEALSDAMAEAGDAFAATAVASPPDPERLRDAERLIRRRCADCHNLCVP